MLRRLIPAAMAALFALALLGCENDDSSSPARYGFTMNLTGMTPHVGQNMWLRVWHADTGVEVGRVAVRPVVTANFTVVVPDVLIAGENYYVDWFADLNLNNAYDAPPVDHAWRRFISSAGPVSIDFMHDTAWTDVDFPL